MKQKIGFGVIFLVLIIGLLIVLPTSAQDEPSPCDLDLSGAAADLIRAQDASSRGDVAQALAILTAVQADLAAVTERCLIQADVTPEPEITLGATLTAENFTLSYPQDWVTETSSENTVFLGNSSEAVDLLRSSLPNAQPGQQGMIVVVGDAVAVSAGAIFDPTSDLPLDEVLTAFINGAVTQSGFTAGTQIDLVINDLPAVLVAFSGATFDGYFIMMRVAPEGAGRYALLAGVAAPSEGEALPPILRAMAESVVYTGDVLETGVQLPQRYTAQNDTFVIEYPDDWVFDNDDSSGEIGGTVNFANTPAAFNFADDGDAPTLLTGQQVVVVVVGRASDVVNGTDDNADLDELMRQFRDDALPDSGIVAGEETRFSINDRRAARLEIIGTGLEGAIYLFETGMDGIYAFAVGLSAVDEYAELDPIVLAMAESLRLGDMGGSLEDMLTPTPFPAPTIPPRPTVIPNDPNVPGSYTAPNGTLTFSYPPEWSAYYEAVLPEDGFLVNFTNDYDTIALLESLDTPFSSGQQTASVTVEAANDSDLSQMTAAQIDLAISLPGYAQMQQTYQRINGQRAVQLIYNTTIYDAIIYIVQLETPGRFAIITGYAAPGERDALQPVILTIAETLRTDIAGTFPTRIPINSTPTSAPTATLVVSAPRPILIGQPVTGTLPIGGIDVWTFEGRAGQVVTIDLTGGFDTTLLVVSDFTGLSIAYNDDRGDGTLNSLIAALPLPSDGIYTIQVGSFSSNAAGGDYTLSLVAGETLRPMDMTATAIVQTPATSQLDVTSIIQSATAVIQQATNQHGVELTATVFAQTTLGHIVVPTTTATPRPTATPGG